VVLVLVVVLVGDSLVLYPNRLNLQDGKNDLQEDGHK